MKKRVLYSLPFVVVVVAAIGWWLWPEPMVTVKTGKMVLCTQGEVVSDDTREVRVPADEVGRHGVKTEVITCERHARLAALRAEVEKALKAGDLAAARVSLEEIVELDPSDGGSAAKLQQVVAGKKPTSGSTDDPPDDDRNPNVDSNDPHDDGPDPGPVGSLMGYVPDNLTGFVAQAVVADPFVLWRDYLPVKPGKVEALVVMAEQHGTEQEVREVITRDVESYYPDGSADVTVAGKAAYFGTRDSLAVLALADGSVRLVLEMQCSDDEPTALRSTIIKTAEEILR